MAKTVNVHAAKTQLSRLIDEAVKGEDVIIAKAGRPVVRLVPVNKELEEMAERRRRSLGSWGDGVWMSDDFNELGDDLARAFGIDPDEERQKRRAMEQRAREKRKRERKRA